MNTFYADKNSSAAERLYDSIVVLALEVVEYAYFSVRKFKVSDLVAGTTHFVTQFHYHNWLCKSSLIGDYRDAQNRTSVSEKTSPTFSFTDILEFDHLAFIDFYFHVKMATRVEDGPMLVHCEEGRLIY